MMAVLLFVSPAMNDPIIDAPAEEPPITPPQATLFVPFRRVPARIRDAPLTAAAEEHAARGRAVSQCFVSAPSCRAYAAR